MRLKKSRATAEEELTTLLNQGWQHLNEVRGDYEAKRAAETFDRDGDIARYTEILQGWADQVTQGLRDIFPTEREVNTFANPPKTATRRVGVNRHFANLEANVEGFIQMLDQVTKDLDRYTDFPIEDRLYVEGIDSFFKVRDVNPSVVADFLDKDGYFDRPEDEIQVALEQILDVPFHKKDWGGEINDLYATNLSVNGAVPRRPSS